ncbi:MAG: hypothetical protein WA110_08365 [Anaerolineaceae bacterium]
MKKRITIILTISLVGAFILAACSTSAPESTGTETVNLPSISGGETGQTGEQGTYPVQAGSSAGSPDTYPVATVMTDAEIEALITEQLQGHHTLEWLLQQDHTREEWVKIIDDHAARGVSFTPEQEEQVITWLLAH